MSNLILNIGDKKNFFADFDSKKTQPKITPIAQPGVFVKQSSGTKSRAVFVRRPAAKKPLSQTAKKTEQNNDNGVKSSAQKNSVQQIDKAKICSKPEVPIVKTNTGFKLDSKIINTKSDTTNNTKINKSQQQSSKDSEQGNPAVDKNIIQTHGIWPKTQPSTFSEANSQPTQKKHQPRTQNNETRNNDDKLKGGQFIKNNRNAEGKDGENSKKFSREGSSRDGMGRGARGEDEEWRDGYVSSLFRGNPQIPVVPDADVTPVSEQVFSGHPFSKLDISKDFVTVLAGLGLEHMTVVQERSIPAVMQAKDVLVKSQTGSGKTLSYALPIMHALSTIEPKIQRGDGLLALAIVPTRELALQSYQWFLKLHKACVWVVPGYLIGGEKKKAEKARLRRGINVLVATPGRLLDHLHHTKALNLHAIKYLVIDEADRLLDMGYERSITSIMETLNEQQKKSARQTVMLSATLTHGVEKLAGMSLVDPVVVDVSPGEGGGLQGEAMATPHTLTHHYVLVPAKLRLVTLAAFILAKCKVGDEKKMIIFFNTQDMVDFHTEIFQRMVAGYGKARDERTALEKRADRVLAGEEDREDEEEEVQEDDGTNILFQKLHGEMTQKERSAVFSSFREAEAGVLLCTDVASRGLDLPRVRWIVQFNAACTATDYVHRVGRTARVNTQGSAVVFLAPAEAPYIQMLHSHQIMLQEIKMQEVLNNLKLAQEDHVGPKQPNQHCMEETATKFQGRVEHLIASDKGMHDMARKAYVSFVRSYASYPKEVREMFSFKALHLGHYAKSLGLRDTPTALGASAAFRAKREIKEKRERIETKKRKQVMRQKMGDLPKTMAFSEFDSGLDAPKAKKAKK